jgi:putative acyl-CoA dehydrogenase
MMMLAHQIESGHTCPISMTYASLPSLRLEPDIAAEWEPLIKSTAYDPSFRPATQKKGVLIGMAMTEKQGGSDVRANTTRAKPIGSGGPGGEYSLTGHKWFCSATMSDAFLVLAQAPGGLSCFLLPRWTPGGERNRFFIQRLKNKLGNRSNASSEVEFESAWARRVGEEGRGIPTIIQMVMHTRLDCVIGAAALMRQAVVQALYHCHYRAAFGKKLIDQPLMQNVLADLCLESEAATVLMMRLARAFDQRNVEETGRAMQRLATALSKYWFCKRTPYHVFEALECLGGNGFVEDSCMPRLYREAPLNSIWEGSGNVNCLDVLRALRHEPELGEAVLSEIKQATSSNRDLDRTLDHLKSVLSSKEVDERGARLLVEHLAIALQASLLLRYSPPAVAEAFCASRLRGEWGHSFGTLPSNTDFKAILKRAWGEY